MLLLRRAQVEVFREQLLKRFEDDVLAHVRELFPVRCKALGDDGTRALIRHGIDRSRGYGIELEKDVCKYVDLCFYFGREFDVEQPWARPILRSDASGPDRMRALFEVAVKEASDG